MLKANAQITILDTKKLDKIRNGQTYVLVKRLDFPGAAQFLSQMQKNWTLSKGIQYLKYDDLKTKPQPDDSFLSLETLTTRTSINAANMTSIYYLLSFWTLKENYFKKEQTLKRSGQDAVADVYLSIDPGSVNGPEVFNTMDFDADGVLYNWSPGMAGNYLQQLSLLLNAGKKTMILYPITNTQQLYKLSTDTLYVPDFNMINYSAFTGRAKVQEEVDVANVFEKYTYPYKVISKDMLDKKIINAVDPFYYLVFLKINSTKVIYIVNAKTGETIYSRATPFSSNLKAGDINVLFKQIGKE